MDVTYRLNDVEFVWNSEKAESNLDRHDINFYDACAVFFDPYCVDGDASRNDEDRSYILGFSQRQKLLFVVYVERGIRTRIISARPATAHERKT